MLGRKVRDLIQIEIDDIIRVASENIKILFSEQDKNREAIRYGISVDILDLMEYQIQAKVNEGRFKPQKNILISLMEMCVPKRQSNKKHNKLDSQLDGFDDKFIILAEELLKRALPKQDMVAVEKLLGYGVDINVIFEYLWRQGQLFNRELQAAAHFGCPRYVKALLQYPYIDVNFAIGAFPILFDCVIAAIDHINKYYADQENLDATPRLSNQANIAAMSQLRSKMSSYHEIITRLIAAGADTSFVVDHQDQTCLSLLESVCLTREDRPILIELKNHFEAELKKADEIRKAGLKTTPMNVSGAGSYPLIDVVQLFFMPKVPKKSTQPIDCNENISPSP